MKRATFERQTDLLARNTRRSMCEWVGSGACSIVIHLLVLIALAFLLGKTTRSGMKNARQTDDVGIVLSDVIDDKTPTETSESEATAHSDESRASESSSRPLEEAIESFLPTNEIGVTSDSSSSSSQILSSIADSRVAGSGASGQRVGFGDARGTGSKFVYVVDRSDSMNWRGHAPLRRAIADAVASVESLDPKQGASKFQIIAFNHDVEFFEGRASMLDVSRPTKSRAIQFLNALTAFGGTAPEQALEAAIKLKPDVVFFLTDADEELSELTLERAKTLRRQYQVRQICVVEFGRATERRKTTYRRLAGENGGTYVFKDIDSFE